MLMIIALVFISLAALLHVYIFYLEVFAWEKPAARKVFGEASVEELAITRFFAYNQGVYNLLLAIIAGIGVGNAQSRPDAGRGWFHDCGCCCAGAQVPETSWGGHETVRVRGHRRGLPGGITPIRIMNKTIQEQVSRGDYQRHCACLNIAISLS